MGCSRLGLALPLPLPGPTLDSIPVDRKYSGQIHIDDQITR